MNTSETKREKKENTSENNRENGNRKKREKELQIEPSKSREKNEDREAKSEMTYSLSHSVPMRDQKGSSPHTPTPCPRRHPQWHGEPGQYHEGEPSHRRRKVRSTKPSRERRNTKTFE